MKWTATITKAGATVQQVEINAGEPLAVPLDGASPWSTEGATVRAYQGSTLMTACPWTLSGGALQLSAAASAALVPNRYRVQVWLDTGTPATDGSADLIITVH